MSEDKVKLPPRRVYADDLEMEVDGEKFHPRRGQWVEYKRGVTWGYFMAQLELTRLRERENEPTGAMVAWERLVQRLQENVVAWDWADEVGNPLPQPYRNPEAFAMLSNDEIAWLNGNVVPEAPKNS